VPTLVSVALGVDLATDLCSLAMLITAHRQVLGCKNRLLASFDHRKEELIGQSMPLQHPSA
jgi:hypothetical protein